MKTNSLLRIILFIMIAGLLSLNCSPKDTSEVTIRINLGLHNQNAINIHKDSIIDRIFRFFVRDAKAQAAPEGITAIELNITGEGMSAINESYSAGTSVITIDVPAGPARVCQVTAYRPTGDWGGSSAPYDLEAGESVEIPISMALQNASITINPVYPNNATLASSTLTCTVNVTTSGEPVPTVGTFTPGTPIDVPAGASKDFEVLVNTPSVTFRGIVLGQNLTAGSSVTLPVNVTLYETRIVLPDSSNSRIVQINDLPLQLTSPVWIAKDASNTSDGLYLNAKGINVFKPYDIDFDSQGRIYMVNWDNAYPMIIRIDDINDTVPEAFNTAITYMEGLAVDRVNSMIYFVDGSHLYRCNDYDCSSIKNDFDMGSMDVVRGIDITDSGLLVIAQYNSFTIYNPNLGNGTIINSLPYTGVSASEAWDMSAKGARIFGAFCDTGGPSFIVEFSLNASNQLVEAGIYNTSLYGPRRFMQTMSNKIYFNDENFTLDRFTGIDDISGAGRVDYGSNGNETAGEGRFDFFL